MIGKKQIETLKLLGYVDTQEDGAILEHPEISHGTLRYVWHDDEFKVIMQNFTHRFETSLRSRIAHQISPR